MPQYRDNDDSELRGRRILRRIGRPLKLSTTRTSPVASTHSVSCLQVGSKFLLYAFAVTCRPCCSATYCTLQGRTYAKAPRPDSRVLWLASTLASSPVVAMKRRWNHNYNHHYICTATTTAHCSTCLCLHRHNAHTAKYVLPSVRQVPSQCQLCAALPSASRLLSTRLLFTPLPINPDSRRRFSLSCLLFRCLSLRCQPPR